MEGQSPTHWSTREFPDTDDIGRGFYLGLSSSQWVTAWWAWSVWPWSFFKEELAGCLWGGQWADSPHLSCVLHVCFNDRDASSCLPLRKQSTSRGWCGRRDKSLASHRHPTWTCSDGPYWWELKFLFSLCPIQLCPLHFRAIDLLFSSLSVLGKPNLQQLTYLSVFENFMSP